MNPLTLETLQVFPLPKSLEALPKTTKKELITSTTLLNGYLRSLQTYTTFNKQALDKINQIIETYNGIIKLVGEYSEIRTHIEGQLDDLQALYDKFTTLQQQEYKMLAANYNVDMLIRVKFKRLVELDDSESREMARKFKPVDFDDEFEGFVQGFRKARKQYHWRREVLNRWEEERVSGAF